MLPQGRFYTYVEKLKKPMLTEGIGFFMDG